MRNAIIQVRKANLGDLPDIWRLHYRKYRSLGYCPELDSRALKLYPEYDIDTCTRTHALVATLDGIVVGTLSMTLDDNSGTPLDKDFPEIASRARNSKKQIAFFWRFCVEEEVKGFASRELLRSACALAVENKADLVYCETNIRHVAFYRKAGFKVVGTKQNPGDLNAVGFLLHICVDEAARNEQRLRFLAIADRTKIARAQQQKPPIRSIFPVWPAVTIGGQSSGVTIRRVQNEQEFEQSIDLLVECYGIRKYCTEGSRDKFRDLEKPHTEILVALTEDSKVVGTIRITKEGVDPLRPAEDLPPDDYFDREVWMARSHAKTIACYSRFAVDPKYWGNKAVSSALIQEAVSYTKRNKIRRCVALINPRHQKLYELFGFVGSGQALSEMIGQEKADAVFMVLDGEHIHDDNCILQKRFSAQARKARGRGPTRPPQPVMA